MAGSRASPRTHLSFSRCDRSAWTSPEVDGRRPESLATTCGTIGALGCVPALGIIITGLARGSPSWTSPGDKPRNQTSSCVAIFGVCFLAAKGDTRDGFLSDILLWFLAEACAPIRDWGQDPVLLL